MSQLVLVTRIGCQDLELWVVDIGCWNPALGGDCWYWSLKAQRPCPGGKLPSVFESLNCIPSVKESKSRVQGQEPLEAAQGCSYGVVNTKTLPHPYPYGFVDKFAWVTHGSAWGTAKYGWSEFDWWNKTAGRKWLETLFNLSASWMSNVSKQPIVSYSYTGRSTGQIILYIP